MTTYFWDKVYDNNWTTAWHITGGSSNNKKNQQISLKTSGKIMLALDVIIGVPLIALALWGYYPEQEWVLGSQEIMDVFSINEKII